MKRVLIALMLSLVLVNASVARSTRKKTSSDKSRDGLMGMIHTVRTESFVVRTRDEELPQPRRVELTNSTYNRAGDQSEWDRWDTRATKSESAAPAEWKVVEKIVTRFDRTGAKTESKSFSLWDEESWVDHRWVYGSRVSGISVELFTYDRGGEVICRSLSTYTSDGEEIEDVWYRADGSVASRTYFQYDGASRLVSQTAYQADGRLNRKEVYSYDQKGNLVQEDTYDERLELFQRTVHSGYEFDSAGNWIKRVTAGWWGHDESTEALSSNVASQGITYRTLTYY